MPPRPPPPVAAKRPPKSSILPRVFAWLFVVFGILGIGWMILLSPKEKKLVCDPSPSRSLLYFGTCHTEDE